MGEVTWWYKPIGALWQGVAGCYFDLDSVYK